MFEVDHLAVQIFSFDLADAHTHTQAGPFSFLFLSPKIQSSPTKRKSISVASSIAVCTANNYCRRVKEDEEEEDEEHFG